MPAPPKANLSLTKRIAIGVVLATALVALFAQAGRVVPRAIAANHDFISYWSTAKLLAARANPYDRATILAMEHQQGGSWDKPYIMRNPPWALILTLPLALFDVPAAALLWMLAIVASALAALRLLRPEQMRASPLTAVFFAPTLICVGAEQTSVFVLLGIALFLRLEQRRPFAAGLALTLAMMKPHLLLLFWLVLALESLRRREIRIVAGMAVGIAVTSLAAMALDPHVWSHYSAAMRAEGMESGFYPNISSLLRSFVAPGSLWVESLPTVAALLWAVWYWARARARWSWAREGSMAIAVSVFVAPYSWPFDQVLFLPAILIGLANAPRKAALVLGVLNLCELAVALRFPILGNPWYAWTAPAWMLWCAFAFRSVPIGANTQPSARPASETVGAPRAV
jgi:Glycosyltransferase family 87